MKTILIILVFATFSSTQIIRQFDFEETGKPDNISGGGTYDWDYNISPLEKLESVEVNSNLGYIATVPTAVSEIYGFFITRASGVSGSNNNFIQIRLSSTIKASIYIHNTHLSGLAGSGSDIGTFTLSTNTKYYIWYHYKTSTGTDGILQAWISTTGIKPATPDVDITNHNVISNVDRQYLYGTTSTIPIYFDYFTLSSSAIGDYIEPTTDTGFKEHSKFKRFKSLK